MNKLSEKTEELIAPVVKAMGYDLWGIKLHRIGKKILLQVYIDVPLEDMRKSISIDDCSRVSRQIGALFDVENLIAGSYDLEVSSPGIKRPLFNREHYQRYIGSLASINLRQAKEGRHNFTGKIQSVCGNKVELITDNEIITFELANINKANLIIDI